VVSNSKVNIKINNFDEEEEKDDYLISVDSFDEGVDDSVSVPEFNSKKTILNRKS
jgi:hypothetical protein